MLRIYSMNKIFKMTGILMLMLTIFTTFSCSNDDDKTPSWHSLAGEYTGWTSGQFKYSSTPIVTDNEKLTIAVSDSKMSMQLASSQWGTATISDVTIAEQSGEYKLSGTGSATLGMAGSQAKQYDCNMEGTVSKDKKTVSVTLTYPAVMGGTTVVFAQGKAPSEE